jgi:hypothetical protein
MNTVTIWDFRRKQLLTTDKCHFDLVGAASYRQVFALKDLKLQESATELSSMYIARIRTRRRAQNIGFIKSNSGETISKRNMLV